MFDSIKNLIITKVYAVDVGVAVNGDPHPKDFNAYMVDVYSFAWKLGGILAILMMVYAGYKYIFSRGEDAAVKDAKDIIWGAILGLIILALIHYILKFLGTGDPGIKFPSS